MPTLDADQHRSSVRGAQEFGLRVLGAGTQIPAAAIPDRGTQYFRRDGRVTPTAGPAASRGTSVIPYLSDNVAGWCASSEERMPTGCSKTQV